MSHARGGGPGDMGQLERTAAELLGVDPGVARLVELLQRHHFETTDSGDGASKRGTAGEACMLAVPHVHAVTGRDSLAREAHRLLELVNRAARPGVLGEHTDAGVPRVLVEATYSPMDGIATLSVYGLADVDLLEVLP